MAGKPRFLPQTYRQIVKFSIMFALVGGAVVNVVQWIDSFGYSVYDGTRYRYILLAALLALYPAVAFFRGPVRRWRRRKNGWCVACGYDLTGNVSGVCPECGRVI